MMKTRHKHGFHATLEQIDVLIDIVNSTAMDESWFGEIREAVSRDGNTVHVVKDMELGTWLSFRYAVSLVDQGICSARDYVTAEKADVYEAMLRQLGIVDKREDDESVWCARFVSKSKFKLGTVAKAVKEEDKRKSSFVPSKTRVRKDGDLFYLDLSRRGVWSRSQALWLARRSDMDLAFEVWFMGYDEIAHHVIYDGNYAVLAEADRKDRSIGFGKDFISPHDIVGKNKENKKGTMK